MYLHFVNPKDNSIMEVDAVLALIDKNSDYLDELYKEFNVLLSEVSPGPLPPSLSSSTRAHLPLLPLQLFSCSCSSLPFPCIALIALIALLVIYYSTSGIV